MILSEYIYKNVKVTTKDGRVLEGEVVSYEGELTSYSGYNEICIDYIDHLESVDESEIKKIIIITQ